MNFRIFGKRRSMRIWAAPPVWAFSLLPRKRLSKAIKPVAGLPISKLPMRVSVTISPADIAHTIASHSIRRALRASITGKKWSSMNSIMETTISAREMSSIQALRAFASTVQLEAAWIVNAKPGIFFCKAKRARSVALTKWVSMVTITTRIGV